MCRLVPCTCCTRPTWEGCGQHRDAVLSDVAEVERCPGWKVGTCGFVRQRVPNDGACLYTAVDLLHSDGTVRADASPRLRALVAESLLRHPDAHGEAVLGAPLAAYVAELRLETSWGGEVEIRALAAELDVTIAVVPLQTPPAMPLALLLHGAGARRMYLAYTGSHYDPLLRASGQTLFSADLDEHDRAALALGEALRAKGEGAPKAVKMIKCLGCAAIVRAEDAKRHGEEVAHDDEWCFKFEDIAA